MIKTEDDAVSTKVSSPSVNKDADLKDRTPFYADKTLESQSVRSMPPMTQSPSSDRFRIVKNKLKQNTPAMQTLPTTRRNPKEVGNLLIIVFLSMVTCVTILYFISPLAVAAGTQQTSKTLPEPPPPPLLIYFVVSGSVPVTSSTIIAAYAKFHLIRFADADLDSLRQITRTLLADDLMKIGVASAKIRASGTVTLFCSSLFISEYCGQTWSAAGCPTGMTGAACDECLPGRYGSGCKLCPNPCAPHGVCDGVHGAGRCICENGWDGPSCSQQLPA